MGIENLRRWPTYIIFGVLILLLISLLNSWSMENELRNEIMDISVQLKECSKQQSSCLEESLSLLEQREVYVAKVNDLDKQKQKLGNDMENYKGKAEKYQSKVNLTLLEVKNCKTELESLKNLQLTTTATLDALRLEKDQLKSELQDKGRKIDELDKEIEKLKSALTTKSSAPSKVTPEAQMPKVNAALEANNPINEPALEDAAKEDIDDPADGNLSNIDNGDDVDPNI